MDMLARGCIRLREATRATRRSEAGQGLVEYAMIFLCMALLLIIVVGVIGQQVHGSFSNASSQFP